MWGQGSHVAQVCPRDTLEVGEVQRSPQGSQDLGEL